MSKSPLPNLFLCLLLLVLVNASCSNETSTKANTDTPIIGSTGTGQNTLVKFGGTLDTLYIDSASFVKVPNGKIVMQFIFTSADNPTLHGWNARGLSGNRFDSLPDIKLMNGPASGLSFGPATYFGNEILRGTGEVKKALKDNKAQYVLFAPQKDGEHIKYALYVIKGSYSKTFNLFAPGFRPIFIDIEANPSPPREN